MPISPPVVQTAKCKMVPKYHPGQCHSHQRRQRRPSDPQPSFHLRLLHLRRRGDTTGLGTTPSTRPSPCRPSGRRDQTCFHAGRQGFREPRARALRRLEMPSEVVESPCPLPGRRAQYPLSRGTSSHRHKGPEKIRISNSRDLPFSRWRSCSNSSSSSSSDRCSIRRWRRHRAPPRRHQLPQ